MGFRIETTGNCLIKTGITSGGQSRRAVLVSIKFVKQTLVTTGSGWVDADPEIRRLKPDIYVVNEDGTKSGKREYCAELGIEYLVLKRPSAPGLPKCSSMDLRGIDYFTKFWTLSQNRQSPAHGCGWANGGLSFKPMPCPPFS